MDAVSFGLGIVALLLALISLGVPLARWLGLPFPVVLAASGIVYGTLSLLTGFRVSGGEAVDNFELWFLQSLALDANTLLYVFLPPLLYEMSLAVNVRRMLADLPTVMLMAVFAVVLATAAVGLAVWSVSEFGLIACLLLGAAVATTDPAAVITTFREIGAPRRLTVILEGESLLNDAAAIAIFTALLVIAVEQTTPKAGAVAVDFLISFGGGGILGLAFALVAARLYPLLGRSAVAEASMTVALAYGVYLVSSLVGVSGVVAVVVAGLATGTVGFVRMGPGNWNTVRAVWTQVGFWANGFILFLVATLTPALLAQLDREMLLLVPVVYLGALAARALVLYGILPVIERVTSSEPMESRQKALVLWGGVRGALTLVLALALTDIEALGSDAQVAGALAAAFTLATLVLNASTLAFVTRKLGLLELSPADLAMRERIVSGSIERVRSVVADLAARRALEPEALAAVEEALTEQRRDVERETGGQRIPFGDRLRVGLAILGAQEARLVRRAFEEGAIGPRVTTQMRFNAEELVEAARAEGRDGYEESFERQLRAAATFRFAMLVHRITRWDRPVRSRIELRLTGLLETDRVLRDLGRFARETLAPMIGEDAARNLAELLDYRLVRVNEEIDAVSLQYPDYGAELERVLLMRAAIRRERQQYQRLLNDGIIGQELHDDLSRALDRRERVVAVPPRLDLELKPRDLVERVPLFQGLDPRQRRAIARRLRTRLVAPDEVVLEQGTRGTEMYFVASGALEVRGAGEPVQLSNGDFFGEIAILSPMRRRQTSVVSLGFGRLLSLSRRDFARLCAKEPAIEETIRAAAARQLDRGFGERCQVRHLDVAAARMDGADAAAAGRIAAS